MARIEIMDSDWSESKSWILIGQNRNLGFWLAKIDSKPNQSTHTYKRKFLSGLKLDGFGKCFDNILVNSPWSNISNKRMKWGKFSKYKFYLAFENSIHCNDYMSEKVWRNSLEQGLVPVIYGPHPDDVEVRFYCAV